MTAELGNLPALVNAWYEAHESGSTYQMRSVNESLREWQDRPDRDSWQNYEHGPYVDELVHYLTSYPEAFSWDDRGVQEVLERLDDVFREEEVVNKKKEHTTTTGADLVPVLAEWEQAIANLKTARKSFGAWQRRYLCREPELDCNAIVLVEKAKELARATRTYRSMFDQAKLRGFSEVISADEEDNPFS
jgi:hypothetical protein